MKKIIYLIFLLVGAIQIGFSQNAIAKIKFEEAEEAYANSNYELTLTKLKDAENILAATNPKIMYLQIKAHEQILKSDYLVNYEHYIPTTKLCSIYLKEYENIPENDEKYRDIYKVLEYLKPLKRDYFNEANKYFEEKKYSKAESFYKISAEMGETGAMYMLAIIYYSGHVGAIDYVKAHELTLKAANKGHLDAMCSMAVLYSNGQGVKLDYQQAMKWCLKASEYGYKKAMLFIAELYETGKGVEKNLKLADEWKKKAENSKFESTVKEVMHTSSGLEYIILKKGTGPKAIRGKDLTVHFNIYIQDGTLYASSIESGEPSVLGPSSVEMGMGMEEGISLMNIGDKYRIILPWKKLFSDLVYRDPNITPETIMIFDVFLLDVQ